MDHLMVKIVTMKIVTTETEVISLRPKEEEEVGAAQGHLPQEALVGGVAADLRQKRPPLVRRLRNQLLVQGGGAAEGARLPNLWPHPPNELKIHPF